MNIRNKLRLIIILGKSDFRKKYVGSFLGIFWMFVQPVISVLIYYCVFQLGFKANPIDSLPFVAWILPGIVPWFYFNDAVSSGVSTFLSYRHLVKKLPFDIYLLPAGRILSSIILHFIFLVVMFIVLVSYGVFPSFWWLQIIYYEIAEVILISSIVYLTAAVNVFIKDMGQFVNIMLQFGFWIAPIMYDPQIMPNWIQIALRWNPFTYIVNGFRQSVLFHVGFWMLPKETLTFWVITIILMIVSCYVYKRLEQHFADIL